MANNTIKGKFRRLYQEVQENLTVESKEQLLSLGRLTTKALYEYKDNLLEILESKYLKIVEDLAKENNISVEEIECRKIGNIWDSFIIAIEYLNESIKVYPDRSAEEFAFEQYRAALDEFKDDGLDWEGLRREIYGYDDDLEDEDEISDLDEQEYPDEERERDEYVFELEKILNQKLTVVVDSIKSELNLSGQTIDFLLRLTLNE